MKSLFITSFLLISVCAWPQITGQVKSYGTALPIKGAEVFVDKSQVRAFSDDKGYFTLEGVPQGTVTIGCLKAGFETTKKIVNVNDRESTALFILQKESGKKLKDETLQKEILSAILSPDNIVPNWASECSVKNFQLKSVNTSTESKSIYGTVDLDNNAIGYNIKVHVTGYNQQKPIYILQYFPLTGSPDQQQQWAENCLMAYQFSVNNFLESVLQGTSQLLGYSAFNEDNTPVEIDKLLVVGYSGHSNRLKLDRKIKVKHSISDKIFESWIQPKKRIVFNDLGLILNSDSVKLDGIFSGNSLSRQLPMDYSPPLKWKTFKLDQYFEKAYAHTDKQYYYPGDTLWYKVYMNYQTLSLIESLSKVLHVELLDSYNGGRILESKIHKIDDGEAWGEFILPDSLPSDFIALRTYTNWQRNFGEGQVFMKYFPFLKRNINLQNERQELQTNNRVKLKFNKSSYFIREKINLAVSVVNEKNEPVSAWMSVSVTDRSMVKLLQDSVNINSAFTIKPIVGTTKIDFPLERGLDISGQYVDERQKSSKVSLILLSSSFAKGFEFDTDVYGKFSVSGLEFYDSITVSYSAREGKYDLQGGKLNLEKREPLPVQIKWPEADLNIEPADYKIDKNVTLLKDIVIKAKRRVVNLEKEKEREKENKMIRPFGQPDYILTGKDLNTKAFNVIEMMRGRIPGLSITGSPVNYQIKSNRSGSFIRDLSPAVVIDDVPVGGSSIDGLLFINPADVVAIEVILRLTALAGSLGGNGIILVYTKAGGLRGRFGEYETVYNIKLKGFSKPLAFKGISHEDNFLPANSDFRTTLYWNPSVISAHKDRPGIISFYASDSTGPYLITIEGVTSEGKPFRTEKLIEIVE